MTRKLASQVALDAIGDIRQCIARSDSWDPNMPATLAEYLFDGGKDEEKMIRAIYASDIALAAAEDAVDIIVANMHRESYLAVRQAVKAFLAGYATGATDVGRMFSAEARQALIECFAHPDARKAEKR